MGNKFFNLEEYEKILGNPREFIETCCYITTKEGKFQLLKLNEPQDKLMKIVERQLANNEPIRVRILKARQMGFSTLISALGFWWAGMNENSSYAVVAHKDSSASSIFNKNKIFYDNLPPALKPQTDKFNSEQISFNNASGTGLRSRIFFGTAGGGELFRGETILFMHKSEIAFWDDKNKILKKSLNATVPLAPFSAIFEETTANGYNEFKDGWDRSVKGLDEYVPLFVGWNEMSDYVMKPRRGFTLTDEELELQMEYDLTDEQLCWRRHKIDNDFDGDILSFQQEYPLTPEEAFLASGSSVFDSESIKKGYQYSSDPIDKMTLQSVLIKPKLEIWEHPVIKEQVEYQQLTRWSVEKQDYEYYDSDIVVDEITLLANYTVGVDTSGMGADWNRVSVWNNITKQMVARLGIETTKEETLAKISVEIARYYNNAMIIPEVNFSHAICDYIIDEGYDNIYLTENINKIDKKLGTLEYGWKTTKSTKAPLISSLRRLTNDDPGAIPDKEFWGECEYYVMEDRAKQIMNAVSGHFDDLIMSNAIGYYGCNSFQARQTFTTKKKKVEKKKQERGTIGIEGIMRPRKSKTNRLKKGVYTNNA